MQEQYLPKSIEAQEQQYWDENATFAVDEKSTKEKFYCLAMLPYPSGRLHMGHVRNYTLGDVVARYQRMCGKNVMQPIGWDAFGLPAENAAIQRQVPPATWTYQNIAQMRAQLKQLGFAYDWQRELATCDPAYYRWEQWFFTQLFEKGLVYKKLAVVNWDPVDQTVLANEQVVDGRGWRSGALVEQREISQWFMKITAYAEELLNDIDTLNGWPDQVRTMQRHWIGRSQGIEIDFHVSDHADNLLTIFTTRPDTLYGVTYLGIAPQHPLAKAAAEKNSTLAQFINDCKQVKVAEAELATMEKTGMDTGLTAIHPLTGEKLPIWVANFVLMEYGAGAVMAVPGHDQRDFEFASKYQLPIIQVIIPTDKNTVCDVTKAAYTAEGQLINSAQFNGLGSNDAVTQISQLLEQQSKGRIKINYRLRDWGISRQRYWGAPIPIIYCPACGEVPVPEKDLPVVLPENVSFSGTTSPLCTMPEFLNVPCPKCGIAAKRETDTFDTFMESSWYYLRYACFDQHNSMLDERANYWAPVDQYIGGIEHAVMHLLYARFYHKLLRDAGIVNSNEPFKRLLTQGMVLKDGSKMSKSKGNTVDPQDLIDKYGADTVRLFIMFAAPPEQSLEWSDSGVDGASRFLRRVWTYCFECQANLRNTKASPVNNAEAAEIRQQIHKLLKQALQDYSRMQFNTVVSACMKLLNILSKLTADTPYIALQREGVQILLRLLAPITPHMVQHLWRELGWGNIVDTPLAVVDAAALLTDEITLVLQINGKRRGEIKVAADLDNAAIEALVLADPQVQKYLDQQTIKKFVVVPQRLINIVV